MKSAAPETQAAQPTMQILDLLETTKHCPMLAVATFHPAVPLPDVSPDE
jgi:hypothetical protein